MPLPAPARIDLDQQCLRRLFANSWPAKPPAAAPASN